MRSASVLFFPLLRDVLMLSDELIRQITIICAERGLLLLRVRDEARMRISAYETLYESSIAYGIRKALMAEQKKMEYEQRISELKTSKSDLEQQVEQLKSMPFLNRLLCHPYSLQEPLTQLLPRLQRKEKPRKKLIVKKWKESTKLMSNSRRLWKHCYQHQRNKNSQV